jgi:acetyl-CoA synthetase
MNPRAIDEPGRWDDLRARFRWRVPAKFTIARACCDVWAEAEPGRVAIVHLERRRASGVDLRGAEARLRPARERLPGAGDRAG